MAVAEVARAPVDTFLTDPTAAGGTGRSRRSAGDGRARGPHRRQGRSTYAHDQHVATRLPFVAGGTGAVLAVVAPPRDLEPGRVDRSGGAGCPVGCVCTDRVGSAGRRASALSGSGCALAPRRSATHDARSPGSVRPVGARAVGCLLRRTHGAPHRGKAVATCCDAVSPTARGFRRSRRLPSPLSTQATAGVPHAPPPEAVISAGARRSCSPGRPKPNTNRERRAARRVMDQGGGGVRVSTRSI